MALKYNGHHKSGDRKDINVEEGGRQIIQGTGVCSLIIFEYRSFQTGYVTSLQALLLLSPSLRLQPDQRWFSEQKMTKIKIKNKLV